MKLENLHYYVLGTLFPLPVHLNRSMSKSKGWTLLAPLLKLWMDENMSQQSNKKFLTMENLQVLSDITTKLSQIIPTQGIETGALNR